MPVVVNFRGFKKRTKGTGLLSQERRKKVRHQIFRMPDHHKTCSLAKLRVKTKAAPLTLPPPRFKKDAS